MSATTPTPLMESSKLRTPISKRVVRPGPGPTQGSAAAVPGAAMASKPLLSSRGAKSPGSRVELLQKPSTAPTAVGGSRGTVSGTGALGKRKPLLTKADGQHKLEGQPPYAGTASQGANTPKPKPKGRALQVSRLQNQQQAPKVQQKVLKVEKAEPIVETLPASPVETRPAVGPQCTGVLQMGKQVTCRTINHETVFSMRYSMDGQWLAASTGDGVVHVFTAKGKLQRRVRTHPDPSGEELPCVAVRWRPPIATEKTADAHGIALCACSNGTVQRLNLLTGQHLGTLWERGNEVLAVDWAPDASAFASAGNDRVVRVYNEETQQCVTALQSGIDYQGRVTSGHSNRIFCVKFAELGTNVLLSGGWDNTIQVYDLRTNRSARTLYGAKISGDALDVRGPHVLAASCRIEDQISMFDWSTGRQVPTEHLSRAVGETSLYAAKFAASGEQCWVTGTHPHTVLGMNIKSGTVVGSLLNAQTALFALDVAPDGKSLAVGGSNDALYFMEIL